MGLGRSPRGGRHELRLGRLRDHAGEPRRLRRLGAPSRAGAVEGPRLMATRTFDRSRLRLGVVIAVICGAIAFLVLQGLGEATTFYRDADDAVAKRDDLGEKPFRLQGVVRP